MRVSFDCTKATVLSDEQLSEKYRYPNYKHHDHVRYQERTCIEKEEEKGWIYFKKIFSIVFVVFLEQTHHMNADTWDT